MPDENQVFVLVIVTHDVTQGRDVIVRSKPQSVVFDTLSKLRTHLMDLVVTRHIAKYEDRFAIPLVRYRKDNNFNAFVLIWRSAHTENRIPTGFDAYWEDSPQVVL